MSNKLVDLNALSEYKTQSDLKYQDKLTAGTGISITNNVISATGGGGGSLAWTLKDTKTGKTAISLPSSFNELLVVCAVAGSTRISLNIPYQEISNTNRTWATFGGIYGTNQWRYYASYNVKLSQIVLNQAGADTADNSSTSITSVYYR